MKTLLCFFLLFSACLTPEDAFAKKIKPYRINITHYDNKHVKGILYDVTENGIALVEAGDVLHVPKEMIVKGIKEGRIQVIYIPFDQIKVATLKRPGSAGRGLLIGAAGSFVIVGAISILATSSQSENQCGCGLPAALILPPFAAFLGGAIGSIVGLFPKKVVIPDPKMPFESTRKRLYTYILSSQLNN